MGPRPRLARESDIRALAALSEAAPTIARSAPTALGPTASRYIEVGRNPAAGAKQRIRGREFEEQISESIREGLINKGVEPSEATRMATERNKEIKSGLAALHEPDMVVGAAKLNVRLELLRGAK